MGVCRSRERSDPVRAQAASEGHLSGPAPCAPTSPPRPRARRRSARGVKPHQGERRLELHSQLLVTSPQLREYRAGKARRWPVGRAARGGGRAVARRALGVAVESFPLRRGQVYAPCGPPEGAVTRYVRIVRPGGKRVRIADAGTGRREREVDVNRLHEFPDRNGVARRTGYALWRRVSGCGSSLTGPCASTRTPSRPRRSGRTSAAADSGRIETYPRTRALTRARPRSPTEALTAVLGGPFRSCTTPLGQAARPGRRVGFWLHGTSLLR